MAIYHAAITFSNDWNAKTKFFDGEKVITAGDFKEGDKVSAEVQIAPDRTFDGVNIRLEKKI